MAYSASDVCFNNHKIRPPYVRVGSSVTKATLVLLLRVWKHPVYPLNPTSIASRWIFLCLLTFNLKVMERTV